MLQLSERTLGDWLEHWAEVTPDKEYIVYSDRNLRFTWKQFNERVDHMAKGLLAIGVKKDTHVGIWARNVPDWLTFLYACAKIGAVAVTVNTNYKQAELEYLCENSDMHTLCIVDGEKDSNFVEMTYTMLPELKLFERGHMKSKRFPHMRNVVYIGQEKYRGMYNTAEILLLGRNIDDEELIKAKKLVSCHDTVNMQYTSGTTGFPKGVMLTHYNIANNGFLHSGDLGVKDENGNYRITGRIKDMIIRGGENIYPREIEEFLYKMPGIKDVQVAGVPSKKYGEAVGAFIILHEGYTMNEFDVREFCQGKIARYKIPKYIFFVKEFPMTGSGKIQKFKLKDLSLKLCAEQGIEII